MTGRPSLRSLHCIPDDDDPPGIVARLMGAVPPGSYLVVSPPASDIQVEAMAAGSALLNGALACPITFRNHAEVARLFDGLELVAPGLVSTSQWRSGAAAKPLNAWAGVARSRRARAGQAPAAGHRRAPGFWSATWPGG